MNNLELVQGLVFPITENGMKIMYVTNAPVKTIGKCFECSSNTKEFREEIEAAGFQINQYRSGIEINFDEL